MKKNFLLLILICIFLSGCVSNSEFQELEERVASLEERVNELNMDYNHNSTESVSIDIPHEDEEEIEEEIEEEVSDRCVYSVDTLSAQLIVDECKKLFSIIPEDGQSFDDFIRCFEVQPLNNPSLPERDGYSITLDYADAEEYSPDSINTEKDAITHIEIRGIQSKMDGTIEYQPYYNYEMTIHLSITDYEKAIQVYEGLYEDLATYYENTSDSRSGTKWQATCSDDRFGNYYVFMGLRKFDDGYTIYVTKAKPKQW